jgi:hypothetical protein
VWLGSTSVLVRHQHLADFGTTDPVRRAVLDPDSLPPLPRTGGRLDERRAVLLAAAYAIGRRPHRILALMRALSSRAGAIKGSAHSVVPGGPPTSLAPDRPAPTEQSTEQSIDRCARVLVVARRRFAFTSRPSALDTYPELVDRLLACDPRAAHGTHELVVSLRGYAPWIKTRWGNYVGTLRVRANDQAGELRTRLVAAEPIVARALGLLRGAPAGAPGAVSAPGVEAPAHLSSTWSQVAPAAADDLGFCASFSTPRPDSLAINVTVVGSTVNVVGSGLLTGWTQEELGDLISELFTGRGLTPLPLEA